MNDRNKKSSVLFTPSGCLTEDALMLFVSGTLKGAELELAQQHIAECPLCADAADGLGMWLSENKTGTVTFPEDKEKPFTEFSGQHSEKAHSEKSFLKPLNEYRVRTDILNERVRQRLHAHALIEATESKRLSYKPFVWLAAAASIVIFIGGFYVVWMQTQSDRQKLAMKAREMEKAAHIEDSLLKSITDTADIYVLALNQKNKTEKSLHFVAPVVSETESDADAFDQDELSETKTTSANAAENEIAYAGVPGNTDSSGSGKANQPSELAGVVVTGYGIQQDKKSMGSSVQEEITNPKVSGVATGKSKRSAKKEKESEESVFTIVEEMPSFPGGEAERAKFLAQNLIYPQQAAENGIQGTVYIQFVVDSKGNIKDAKVLRGIGGGCDEEALRVVKLMPRWKPGKQNGKHVRVLYTMPVLFRIQ